MSKPVIVTSKVKNVFDLKLEGVEKKDLLALIFEVAELSGLDIVTRKYTFEDGISFELLGAKKRKTSLLKRT